MGRFARSWELVKASATVLRSERKLLLFPMLSSIAALLVAASFLAPLALSGSLQMMDPDHLPAWMWPFMFLFYLVQYFIIFFFNTALVGAVRMHLDGEKPTVADGIAIALARWPQILGYAAIAATVGLILRMIEERVGWIGRIVIAALGVTWTLATFLVVPVLVNENVGSIEAVKRSVELLKRTWGENIIANGGMALVFGVIQGAWVFAGMMLVILSASAHSAVLAIACLVLVIAGILVLALVQAALQGIYATMLYRYADSGQVETGFDRAALEGAFRLKA